MKLTQEDIDKIDNLLQVLDGGFESSLSEELDPSKPYTMAVQDKLSTGHVVVVRLDLQPGAQ